MSDSDEFWSKTKQDKEIKCRRVGVVVLYKVIKEAQTC